MSSTFSGYSVAVAGMFVNQTGLSVCSHNISNVNTTGYSRQRMLSVDIQTVGTSIGSGTTVDAVQRARNEYLDRSYRQQNANLGYWSAKSTNITDVETVLNELQSDDGTTDNGLQQVITDFCDSWDDLSTDASSTETRSAVLAAAEALIETISQIDDQLSQLQEDCVSKVQDAVADLNDMADQIADLNLQIKQTEALGVDANDLRDQRDELLDEMSLLTNLTVSEQDGGMVNISIGGIPLVLGEQSYTLECVGDGSTDNPLKVCSVEFDTTVKISSGCIKAYLEDADQTGMETIGETEIPYDLTASSGSNISNMWQALNDLVTTIAYKVNELQTSGLDANGDTGIAFFVTVDDSQPLSLSNIQVNSELDYNEIAAGTTGDSEDNTIAAQIAELDEEEYFQYDGLTMDMDDFYQNIISWIGTAGDEAGSSYDNQSLLLESVDTQRQSLSAVSLDEEMSKVIMYQNIYNASARVLSTLDSLVEDMIEELG